MPARGGFFCDGIERYATRWGVSRGTLTGGCRGRRTAANRSVALRLVGLRRGPASRGESAPGGPSWANRVVASRTCSTVAGERRRIVEAGKPRAAGRALWVGGPPETAPIPSRVEISGENRSYRGGGLSMALRMQAVERGPDLAPAIQLRVAGSHAAVPPRAGAGSGTYPR